MIYCAQHNLQAVLDEYAHYLVDAEGLGARPAEERASGVADAMAQALAIRRFAGQSPMCCYCLELGRLTGTSVPECHSAERRPFCFEEEGSGLSTIRNSEPCTIGQ